MSFYEQLFALIFTPTAVLIVMAYLLRQWLSSQISRDLEKFKADLDRSLFEYKTKFSLIHEVRAQVIGELYGKISRASSMLARLVHIFQMGNGISLLDKKKAVAEVAQGMQDYYNEKRIYLDDSTCEKIDGIIEVLHSVFVTFDVAQKGDSYEPDDSGLWREANREFREKWPPLKKALEKEFRDILHGKKPMGIGDG